MSNSASGGVEVFCSVSRLCLSIMMQAYVRGPPLPLGKFAFFHSINRLFIAINEKCTFTQVHILLFDEFGPSSIPPGILLYRPVDAREQVRCAVQLEGVPCLDVESAHHALPGCIVTVCAAIYDESPLLSWV